MEETLTTIGRSLLTDIPKILDRPVFTKAEEELLALLFDEKIERVLDENVEIYRKALRNVEDVIDFNSLGGDYYDMLAGS